MPALREMIQRFRFAGGVETKADPKTVPATQLLALENGVFSRRGCIKKRNGYEVVATVPGAVRSAVRDDTELIVLTDSRAYSISDDGDVSDTGSVYSAVPSDRPLVVTGTQQTMTDHATVNGVTISAWEDSLGGVWWSTSDAKSERILSAPVQTEATGISPRCVAAGDNLHVYYVVAAARRLMVVVVDSLNPTATATPQQLADDIDPSNPTYDAMPTTRPATPSLIAWSEVGTTNIRIGYVDASGALGVPLRGHPSSLTFPAGRAAITPIAVGFWGVDGGNGDILALAYIGAASAGKVSTFGGGSLAALIATTGSVTAYTATSVQRIALVATSATAAWVAFEEAAAAPTNRFVVTNSVSLPAATAGSTATVRSVGLASRAFARGAAAFAVFVHDTASFNVYLTLGLASGFVPIGRHAPGSAAGAPTRKHLYSANVDGDVVRFALPFRQRLIAENNNTFTETSARLYSLDFGSDLSHQHASFGRGLYLAGGCPLHYDGRVWAELGFHVGPELIVAVAAAGGSMTSSTTYLYRAWYESTDGQGEVHRGPISAGTLVTMGAADTQVTLTLPTLRVTGKTNVRIMVARSEAADTGDTAQLFRVTSLDQSTAGTANGFVLSSTTTDTATFIDRLSDTTLATFDELYTDAGILSNDPAPLGAAIARGKTRMFGSDPSDGSIVRHTQPFSDGYGVEWPPDLFTRIDPPAGSVTAISSLDDRVIIWTERAIYTFSGDGPAQDGTTTSGGFSAPQVVPGDVGCTDPASIVLTPSGHIFQTAKGIYMLATDFTIRYVGAPVEAYNGQSVRRALVLPDRTAVVFLTDSGLTLLYDYLFDQWSTFTNHEGVDAAVVRGSFYYVRNDGRIFRETIGEYADDGSRIRLSLETAWVHMLDHLVGFQKFFAMQLIGTWVSPHQLGVRYQLDYFTQWSDQAWFDATAESSSTGWITGAGANVIGTEPMVGSEYGDGAYGDGVYGGSELGLYEWRLDLFEKAESIRFRFEDFEAAGFLGPSFELTELAITGAAIGNVRRPMTSGRSA